MTQKNSQKISFNVIEKLTPLYDQYRYKVLYGGRASGKTIHIADFLIKEALLNGTNTLCCREYQSSLKDSVHRVLAERIKYHQFEDYFIINRDEIKSSLGGIFVFKGLAHNYNNIRSMHDFDYAWVEEAENVSSDSWDTLIPTIRKESSQIIISFNPRDEKNTTYQRFVLNPPQDSLIININYYDNPFFPEVLQQEIEYDKKYNPEKYRHIWLGECKTMSNAIIFKDKYIVQNINYAEENNSIYFNGKKVKLLYGLDYGFSSDPLALIEMFIDDNTLYITKELYGINIENNQIKNKALKNMPLIQYNNSYADNSRPETSSYLRGQGLNVYSADKWPGCVEDGIQLIKSFKNIVIDSQCKNTIYEFDNYSYKIDTNNNEILSVIIDKDNHTIDAIRYGLNDYIKNKNRTLKVNPQSVKLIKNYRKRF